MHWRVLLATILVCGALAARGRAADPPPAEALAQARAAIDAGQFKQAEALLRPLVADPTAPVTDEPAILLEIMRRIRLDYALTPEQMLEKLRRSIPDATAEDVERWRTQGVLQHRVLDGVVWYFVREPSNLFRFSAEAQARRKTPGAAPAGAFSLPEHVAELLAEALAAAQSIADDCGRAEALIPLLYLLPADTRFPVVQEALAAARATAPDDLRAGLLTDLLEFVSEDQRAEVLTEALASARGVTHPDSRAEALSALIDRVGEETRVEFIAEVLAEIGAV